MSHNQFITDYDRFWESLTDKQRQPLTAYLATKGDMPEWEPIFHRNLFLQYLDEHGIDSGPAWLERTLRVEAQDKVWKAEREKARQAEEQAKAERKAAKAAAIQAAVEHGIPIPAEYRYTNRCVHCRRKLTDPESVRLGIGPECRRNLAEERS